MLTNIKLTFEDASTQLIPVTDPHTSIKSLSVINADTSEVGLPLANPGTQNIIRFNWAFDDNTATGADLVGTHTNILKVETIADDGAVTVVIGDANPVVDPKAVKTVHIVLNDNTAFDLIPTVPDRVPEHKTLDIHPGDTAQITALTS